MYTFVTSATTVWDWLPCVYSVGRRSSDHRPSRKVVAGRPGARGRPGSEFEILLSLKLTKCRSPALLCRPCRVQADDRTTDRTPGGRLLACVGQRAIECGVSNARPIGPAPAVDKTIIKAQNVQKGQSQVQECAREGKDHPVVFAINSPDSAMAVARRVCSTRLASLIKPSLGSVLPIFPSPTNRNIRRAIPMGRRV